MVYKLYREWDRFAKAEYERLAMEEENGEDSESSMLWKAGIVTKTTNRTEILTTRLILRLQLLLVREDSQVEQLVDKEQQELHQQLLALEVLTLTDVVIYHIL